eukprot:TRINITY_DN24286_c0_g1_i1.p1 TRINITY_DN24286_c0_g1~~TRINITY_DN24286_c0_g1_i1.p1  ORF type:complete len:383 (-),score=71.48 TRINITY_DN24286_c0_g1_i1:142-1290(-)
MFASSPQGPESASLTQEAEGESMVDDWRSSFGSFVRRARTAGISALAQAEELTAPLAGSASSSSPSPDIEEGGATADGRESRWTAWARQVQQHAAQTAESAQQGLQQQLERAKQVDWTEQVKDIHSNVATGFQRVADGTSSASSSLSASLTEGVERAKTAEWGEPVHHLQRGMSRSFESVSTAVSSTSIQMQERGQAGLQHLSESTAQVGQQAKENAAAAAERARGTISVVGERAQGAATLAMSPMKLAQFVGVLGVGVLFILMSFNFLPILLIAPKQFAMLFTIGSLIVMSSFVLLSGFSSFLSQMTQRSRLPFTVAYCIGLFGTLWATLIKRSYIFTAIFAILQAGALIYFVAGFIPGGRAGLGMMCRMGGRSARSLMLG